MPFCFTDYIKHLLVCCYVGGGGGGGSDNKSAVKVTGTK